MEPNPSTVSSGPDSDGPAQARRRSKKWIVIRLFVLFIGVFIVLAVTGCMERAFYVPSRGTPPPPPRFGIEEASIPTEDGLTLHGWFAPAMTSGTGLTEPHGTILVLHGNAGNISNHFDYVEFLPGAGFNVLILDYRGYGKSDRGRLRRDDVYKDAEAGLDWLLRRDDVNPGQIGMYAQSLGGTFGLHLMAHREEIRSAVVMSAFTRWQDIAAATLSRNATGGPISRFVARTLIRPGLDPIDAIAAAAERGPILLIHGDADEVVPFLHGKQLAEAGGSRVKLMTVEGGDHNGLRWHEPAVDRAIIEHFRETLSSTP